MADKVNLLQVKKALKDAEFRKMLPDEYQNEVTEFIKNPGCPCHLDFLRKVLRNCKDQLRRYFPGKEIHDEEKEVEKLMQNHWTVINCTADELQDKLRKLPPGRKQISVARYENQITLIVNELDIVF